MKKSLTLALTLALVALGSVSWAATSPNSSRIMQKKPPETASINLNSSRSNIYRVKVTQVNKEHKTFAVEVTFSAAKLEAPPNVGETIDTTYTQTSGGPMEATTVKGSKSNGSSYRLTAGQSGVTGKVTQVNEKDKTFTVYVNFSAKNLKDPFPEVGKIIDITYNQPTPGGPLEATTINTTKSNTF